MKALVRLELTLVGALMLTGPSPSPALAQDHGGHPPTAQRPQTAEEKQRTGALVRIVKDATERFSDVRVAQAEGYNLLFGCVSGGDYGAMGLHYVNMPLVLDGEINATRPEIVIYEPLANGQVRLVGADYLVFADAWDKTHSSAPELMGQKFQQFEAPNRFGLPRFYTLHVWAWKDNPTGTFVNWHSNISCDAFSGETQ